MRRSTKIGIALGIGAGATVAAVVLVRRRTRLPHHPRPDRCSYDGYAYDTRRNRSVSLPAVDKPYGDLVDDERSPADPDCTLCEQDLEWVRLPNGVEFQVCWKYAPSLQRALERAIAQGVIVEEVVAYRPGKTVGSTDSQGLRTRWSNHAYGTAFDINPDYNGLYRGSHLSHGGEYRPDAEPERSVSHDSPIYALLTDQGWVWAGDLVDEWGFADWMHFQRGRDL